MTLTKADILNEAIGTVKDRGVPYGGVEQNFGRIALLWDGYAKGKFGPDAPTFTAVDVAAMMALMKLGRIAGNASHHDSWVDLAGYAACGGELASGLRDEWDGDEGLHVNRIKPDDLNALAGSGMVKDVEQAINTLDPPFRYLMTVPASNIAGVSRVWLTLADGVERGATLVDHDGKVARNDGKWLDYAQVAGLMKAWPQKGPRRGAKATEKAVDPLVPRRASAASSAASTVFPLPSNPNDFEAVPVFGVAGSAAASPPACEPSSQPVEASAPLASCDAGAL